MQDKEEVKESDKMSKVKKISKVLSALAVSSLLLSACSSGSKTSSTTTKVDASKFPIVSKSDKKSIKGGILKYGLIADSPFEGKLSTVFYDGQPDFEVLQFFDESLLGADKNYVFDQSGAATYKLSDEDKTITIKIRDNVNWHNGDPVTAEDLEYSYLVIGSKKYTGVRYDTLMQQIVGMEDYHAGKTDKISGIKIIDPKTISITFKQASPSLLTGLWAYPLPKKYLGNVPIDKLVSSAQIRKAPIGFGPFKIKKITPGEAVEFEAYKDYWKGAPKLNGVLLKVVNPTIATASLENGDIDVAQFPTDQYEKAKSLKNIQLVGKTDLYYGYIGFHLGHYDAKKELNIMDNPKLQDKHLRQAMAYAIDTKAIADKLYKGLKFPATTVIPPSLPQYHDKDIKGYTLNVKKAKNLLDEAGYKDKNGDGLREDPNGKPFKLNYLAMSGSDTAQPLSQYYIQSWNKIGLDVQLVDGRLHEFNSFYDMLEKDDSKVDIFGGAWGVGSDPDPSGLWSKDAQYNFPRWINDENNKLLEDGNSPASMDIKHRVETYNKWQELLQDEVPVIPTFYQYQVFGVNDRVKGWDLTNGKNYLSDVSVTSKNPVK
jgi:peptide/nickel transport system substrate-binding protein